MIERSGERKVDDRVSIEDRGRCRRGKERKPGDKEGKETERERERERRGNVCVPRMWATGTRAHTWSNRAGITERGGQGYPNDGPGNIVWQCRNERRFPER